MSDNGPVLVCAEQEHGRLAEVSLELCGKGRELADTLGVNLAAALLGDQVEALAQDLIAHGANEVHLAQDARLEPWQVLPQSRILCDLVRAIGPQIVLFGATPRGRELAPRVASELKAGLTADCTNLEIGDHEIAARNIRYENLLYQIRPAFGGNVIATILCPDSRPQMATVREGVMALKPADPGRKGKILPAATMLEDRHFVAEVLEQHREPRRVNLKGARVIVAGGAGVGSRENFRLVHDLAHVLGAEVGASRSAVDSGFADKEHQIGQTGTTVRPKLYVACGISGAVQHRAGMQESSKIVAINSDPEAPILSIAHYGIVGDLNEVIPMMIDAYRSR